MNDEDHDGHTINLGPPAGSPADERPKWDPREEDDWYPPHAPSTPVDEAERAVWQCGRTDPHNPHASYADAAKVCPGIPGESMAKLNRSEDWTAGAIPINEERHDQLLCCRCCGNRIGITGIGTGICDRDGCDLSMMEQAGARRWGPKAPPAPPVSPPVPELPPLTGAMAAVKGIPVGEGRRLDVGVDELAQIIRIVDGNHTLGAGALAEAILAHLAAAADREDRA